MQILKVISRLMSYPSADLLAHADELTAAIATAKEISPSMRSQLNELVAFLCGQELMDAQECYVGLFDRGRALSLLLFEHVHGESRDRGQAMVDLMGLYQEQGFNISVKELPDYIPLYLEFLAQGDEMDAREGLADVHHILAMLSARLQERESPYHCLFDALLMIAGVKLDLQPMLEKAANESRDDTPEALDKVWEEEAITFGVGDNQQPCPSQNPRPFAAKENLAEPVHWVKDASQRPNTSTHPL